MSKSGAARVFGMSRSSVKRYAAARRAGRSPVPKKQPGTKPKLDEKARKLLEAGVKERPAINLKDRCGLARQDGHLKMSREDPRKGDSGAGSNPTLPAEIQAGSCPSLPILGQVNRWARRRARALVKTVDPTRGSRCARRTHRRPGRSLRREPYPSPRSAPRGCTPRPAT